MNQSATQQVRPAAVAGRFYAGQTAQLQNDVDTLLAGVQTTAPCPKVIVAPHAGYIYSGSVAAQAYARLRNGGEHITRVLLLGPSHRVALRGIATCSHRAYATPLGSILLDRSTIESIAAEPGVSCRDDAHAAEHSLEVHLPFLQRCLGEFSLVPLVVGQASAPEVAAVIDKLWGGPETLIVISTDLSHYLPYAEAQARDAQTRDLIEARAGGLSGEQACGCKPLNGLLQVLRKRRCEIRTVAMNNSGDTAGDKNRVVGYGAWVVEDSANDAVGVTPGDPSGDESPAPALLTLGQRQQLLYLARALIGHTLEGGDEYRLLLENYHPALRAQRASFVTLNHQGRLRGCIGSLTATRPLALDVAHNATAAAFRDRRFKPLQKQEYLDLDVHISVLSPPQALSVNSREELIERLRPGVDGLILKQGEHRSTYLPSVWKQLPDPQRFVAELRAKAGLPRAGWSADTQLWTYTTEEFC